MKLIKKILPYLVLLLLTLSQVVETTKVTNFATRRARRALRVKNHSLSKFESRNRFKASTKFLTSLDENNNLTIWQAFQAAKFWDYIDVAMGFLSAWWSDLGGVWGSIRNLKEFPPFMQAIKKTCYDNLSSYLQTDTNPPTANESEVTSGAAKLFNKIETSSDADNCAKLAKDGTPCVKGEKPAKSGVSLLFAKVMSYWEGFKKFKKCWITEYQVLKGELGDPFKPLFGFLKKFGTIFTITGAIKSVVSYFFGEVTKVAKLLINVLRFCYTLYQTVKKWQAEKKVNFLAVGQLFGLIIKTVLDAIGISPPKMPSLHDLVTFNDATPGRRRRRLMKKYK